MAHIIVIGGGAAGFFAAIHAAADGNQVTLLEKTSKLLSKVKISGGGRCNVMHDISYPSALVRHYPRGLKKLKKAFDHFGPSETRQWFEQRGVTLKTEADGRMFPVTDDSQTIIDCLMRSAKQHGVDIHTLQEVISIEIKEKGFDVLTKKGNYSADRVIITTGGHNKRTAYHWLEHLGIKIVDPVPSLFTFNVPDSGFQELQGVSVPKGEVIIPGTSWKMAGPILITHWGFSAPAVLLLSSWAARDLNARNYAFPILINWTGLSEEKVREDLLKYAEIHPRQQVVKHSLFDLPQRLWDKLIMLAGISEQQRYSDLPKKDRNRLMELLIRCPFEVDGKTTFKEEFVTCGGVALSEINTETFESRAIPGLYFAGEVLDVDGITGGFNFQFAWTSGYLAGRHAGHN